MEDIAKAIDKLESLVYGMRITENDINAKAVQGSLIDILRQLKEGYVKKTGDNPWE